MHGIVHKTLKEYVVERADEASWNAIVDRAGLEPSLYLPVSHYDDEEFEVILETLSAVAVQERPQIERSFGRMLAPAFLSTFNAHVRADWALSDLLESLESITNAVDAAADETSVPDLSTKREGEDVLVTYRSPRWYPDVAHGVLEGVVAEFDTDAAVVVVEDRDDAEGVCTFRVRLE
ncbi:heme NO-binding domain-containing protein [Natrarchaeobius sp. A-rgal3]|uniref:heme NO-binding domain-containing protein n=1 Tax=Natrarchaeobius versutus TaxID=1679078 RepID=UPI00350EF03E